MNKALKAEVISCGRTVGFLGFLDGQPVPAVGDIVEIDGRGWEIIKRIWYARPVEEDSVRTMKLEVR